MEKEKVHKNFNPQKIDSRNTSIKIEGLRAVPVHQPPR